MNPNPETTEDEMAGNSGATGSSSINLRGFRSNYGAERLGDLAIGIALIVFMLPLIALVALAIKLDSPGPLLERQERLDFYGRRFVAFRFRTVHSAGLYIRGAEREALVTPVGQFLRYSSMENLPQLINVLRGEMSAFGASSNRPHFLG